MEGKYEYKYNIMLIGDQSVGKTSILERYFNKSFLENRIATLGMEFYEKIINYQEKELLVKFWDTAGQEKYAALSKNYYKRAHGIILTFAINHRSSFYNLSKWLESIKENSTNDIELIILGNKCDIEKREVEFIEIRNKAKEYNIKFFETSAKEDKNIDEAFNWIIERVIEKSYKTEKGFEMKEKEKEEAKKCCK